MADLLDRFQQRALLAQLADAYPDIVSGDALARLYPGNSLRVNVAYLQEHGLISAQYVRDLSEGPQVVSARITANGIDFLSADGGLGAILSVQTIRIHEDSVRALLIKRVEESGEGDTVKGKLINQLKTLPADGVKTLAEKALDAGLRSLPNVIQWLQTALPSAIS